MGIRGIGDWRTAKLAKGTTKFVHEELNRPAQRCTLTYLLSVVHDYSLVYGTLMCNFLTIFIHMHIQCHFFFHLVMNLIYINLVLTAVHYLFPLVCLKI